MKRQKILSHLLLLVLITSFFASSFKSVQAASLTSMSDVMSRLKASTNSNHSITFTTPTGVLAAGTVTVQFPSGFTMGSGIDYTDVDVTDDGVDLTLAATPSGTTWGAAFGGTESRTLTITSGTGTIVGGSVINIEIGDNATTGATGDKYAQNPTSGTHIISLTAGASDSGSLAVVIVNDDQVVVTAAIDPTISLTVSDNAIGFGTITSSAARWATADAAGSATEPADNLPVKLTASTNGVSGLTIQIKDEGNGSSAGLYSAGASNLIAASTTAVAGSEGYVVYGKGASGLTIAEGFDNDTTSDTAISRTFQTLASTSAPVNNGDVDLALKASISNITEAGSYIDTITIICTGTF